MDMVLLLSRFIGALFEYSGVLVLFYVLQVRYAIYGSGACLDLSYLSILGFNASNRYKICVCSYFVVSAFIIALCFVL